MTVEQQIDAFVQGIQCSTTQSIVVNLAGNPAVRTSFDNYYNAVASRLELAMTLTGKGTTSVTRNVNQVSKNIPKRKNGDYTQSVKKAKHFKAEARRYSPDEWKALTSEQKSQVKALHKIVKSNRQSSGNSVNSVMTANQGAIVPYVHQYPNNQINRVNSFATAQNGPPTASYQGPYYGRSVSQMSHHNQYTPPTPSITVPPLPPIRGAPSGSSLTVDSGEAGNGWGNQTYPPNN